MLIIKVGTDYTCFHTFTEYDISIHYNKHDETINICAEDFALSIPLNDFDFAQVYTKKAGDE